MPTKSTPRRAATEPVASPGWRIERLVPSSRLHGANGLRTGPDGRLYVAQVAGSQVSAIDVDSGAIETVSAMGGNIVAPDDLAFDDAGNLYATEITEGRVSVTGTDGRYRVLWGDMPCANPITFHNGHLYAGECRPGGRILELALDGGAPRVILDNVPMPNAMEVGPDGMLYFPVMGANEIWRVDPAGGAPEVVARDLGVPDAVKFDARGHIVSTQVASGEVLRIDPRNGARTVLAFVAPGLDNLAFVSGRLFVSSISGQINEILPGGELRPLVPDGLQWPLGLAVAKDGTLFVADGGFTYELAPGQPPRCAGMLFSPGFPGYTRGVAATGPGVWTVTTANGQVARFAPAAQSSEVLGAGFDRLMGVARHPGGDAICAEHGTGRVLLIGGGSVTELAGGLDEPAGVAIDAGGRCYVAEAGGGRVVALDGPRADTVLDGLQTPQGIAVHGDTLYVVDVGAKELIAWDLTQRTRRLVACALPVGAPPGVVPKPLGAIGELAGPMPSFCGIAVGGDGVLYVAGDMEGSVLALRRADA